MAAYTFNPVTSGPLYSLPAATGSQARQVVKNYSAGLLTVVPSGTDTIDGNSSAVLSINEAITFVDYAGGKWAIT